MRDDWPPRWVEGQDEGPGRELMDEARRESAPTEARARMRQRILAGFADGPPPSRWLPGALRWAALASVGAAVVLAAWWTRTAPDLPALDESVTGQVVHARGSARVGVPNRWVDATNGVAFALPARIHTDGDSSAKLSLPRGVTVRAFEETDVAVGSFQAILDRGAAIFDVAPGSGGFDVQLGAYRVIVLGTRFWAARDEEDVAVCLLEGRVLIEGGDSTIRLEPRQGWRSSPAAPPLPWGETCAEQPRPTMGATSDELPRARARAPSPDPVTAPQPRDAEPAAPPPVTTPPPSPAPLAKVSPWRPRSPSIPAAAPVTAALGDCAKASDPEACYSSRASGDDLTAQNALYRLGLYRLATGSPSAAMDAWLTYRRRFPSGALLAEVDLSILELHLRQGAEGLAVLAANDYLRKHVETARVLEIRVLRGVLLHRQGDCRSALRDYDAALQGKLPPGWREDALFGQAACSHALKHPEAAAAAYRRYVSEFPSGRFRKDADQALRALAEAPAVSP